MASLKVKQKDGTITQILLGGANGLSLWTAKVEHTDNMELPYSNINLVKNRTVQQGDLILFKDGYIYSVTNISTNSVLLDMSQDPIILGKSAYEYAKDGGFVGTEEEFAASLVRDIPTKISQLENDTQYITNNTNNLYNYYNKENTYSKEQVNSLISGISQLKRVVVDSLPIDGEENTLYLLRIPDEETGLTSHFEEWLWIEGSWELLGTSEIELNGYVKEDALESSVKSILEKIYPVGYIYISLNGTNPRDLFGFGTWEKIQDKFLLGAQEGWIAGETGGEKTHMLTESELPALGGSIFFHNVANGTNVETVKEIDKNHQQILSVGSKSNFYRNGGNYAHQASSHGIVSIKFGQNKPHNNMPPYMTVYMWERTE